MKINRRLIYPILILIVAAIFKYAEEYIDKTPQIDEVVKTQNFFYLPTSTTGSIITHDNYTLSYAEAYEQAEWVAYELKADHLSKNEFKRPYFQEDKKVKSSSAHWRNYKKSGYDKGHLCPAGDRRFSYDAFEETFLTSNISPQEHAFNSGIWNKLEKKVRYWAKRYNGVYVVTGGVLHKNLKNIGEENVAVPEYFYKVILDNNSTNPKMIGFLMPHKDSNKPLKDFIVPVDQIEKLTGIDFYPKLDDEIETRLENQVYPSVWKF